MKGCDSKSADLGIAQRLPEGAAFEGERNEQEWLRPP